MNGQLAAIERDRRGIESVAIRRAVRVGREAQRYALSALTAGHRPEHAADIVMQGVASVIAPALMAARLRGMRRTQLEHQRATGDVVRFGTTTLSRDEEDEKRQRDAIALLLLLLGISATEQAQYAQDARSGAVKIARRLAQPVRDGLASVRVAQASDPVTMPVGMQSDVELKPGVTMPKQDISRVFLYTGMTAANPWAITNWIETATVNEYERGRWDATRHPAVAEALWGYRFDAVLDDRTSNICRSLHNLRMEKNDPEVRQWSPPLHFHCRSTLIPVWQSSEIKEPTPYTPALPDATWRRFENDVMKFRSYL